MEKNQIHNAKQEEPPHINIALKAKYAFYSTLIFFLIANPETYKLTQQILGTIFHIASDSGCPSPLGFFFHSFVFFIVLWGIMLFPRD
uniref:Uncharacterized protein n=1 Tax=viral metagenome TaxID=1070528 RepID=A0A6C0D7S0_9ZZZZ